MLSSKKKVEFIKPLEEVLASRQELPNLKLYTRNKVFSGGCVCGRVGVGGWVGGCGRVGACVRVGVGGWVDRDPSL